MNGNNKDTTFFGYTSFRNERKKFGIKRDDRRRHFYVIGKTGMGKSKLMENMAIQDILNGNGLAYVDPHGEGAESLLDYVPQERIKDVIYFNPADLDFPIAFNVMEKVDFKYRHLVAGGLMAVFKKVWPDVWSARMEYILSNTILALLEYPNSTLLGVNRMLADPAYRAEVVSKVNDPIVKAFWVTEYARYTQRYEIEATAAIQNKVGQFVSNALIRNIIGQTKSSINMRKIMDEGKIFIMDLSKGRIGEDNSRLLGALLITKLQLAAMSRVDIPEEERKDFYLYVDEFQNFATESFANILSEARKYRLSLIVGHQYINQMEEEVRDAVFGNIGTLVVFRVGAEDAEFLEKEFSPDFTAEDLVNLPKYNVYLKLMIDGIASHPFSSHTMPPPPPLEESNRHSIIVASREHYGVAQTLVEKNISDWTLSDATGNAPAVSNPGGSPSPRPAFNAAAKNVAPAARPNMVPKPQSAMAAPGEPQVLYDAICSNCGKNAKVIFPPEPGRAVYCKSCRKKMKRAQEETKITRAPQEPPKVTVPTPPRTGGQEPRRSDVNVNQKKNFEPKPKRKEINLADLKKVIDESIAHAKPAPEPVPEPAPQVAKPKDEDNKKVINPGEKVAL